MSDWTQLLPCKQCGKLPYVLPAGRRKKMIMCDHGEQQVGVKGYENAEAWNAAQQDTGSGGEPDQKVGG